MLNKISRFIKSFSAKPFLFFVFLLVSVFLGVRSNSLVLANDKVTICHRTDSQQNPYEQISVNKSSADGQPQDDNSDHGNHNGGVFPANPWGDIIPSFTRDDGPSYGGKNWTDAGKAVYFNQCNIPMSVHITQQSYSCGLHEVTIQGTAQYWGDTSTTLIVKVNGTIVLNSQSENANWSKVISVVPGQSYTVNAYVYDKTSPDISGEEQDTPKATDSWQFTITNCPDVCPNLEGLQTQVPEGYVLNSDNQCVLSKTDPSPSTVASPTPAPTTNNNGGGGSPGAPQCTAQKPPAPQTLSLTRLNPTTVRLNWTPINPVTYYSIFYGTSKGSYQYGVANVGNVTTYDIGALNPNQTYFFTVKSVNECSPSDPSNEISTNSSVLGASTSRVLGASTDRLANTGTLETPRIVASVVVSAIAFVFGLRRRFGLQ